MKKINATPEEWFHAPKCEILTQLDTSQPFIFREHRGELEDSLATTVSCKNLEDLEDYLAPIIFDIFGMNLQGKLRFEPYGWDDRINQFLYIVTHPEFKVVGFVHANLTEFNRGCSPIEIPTVISDPFQNPKLQNVSYGKNETRIHAKFGGQILNEVFETSLQGEFQHYDTQLFKHEDIQKCLNKKNKKVLILMGNATVGKDTLYDILNRKMFEEHQKVLTRVAFADALKEDLHPFLNLNMGIDVFDPQKDKELIRPILIAYGQAQRAKTPLHWVNKAIEKINSDTISHIFCVTDCRFPNELEYLKENFDCHSVFIDRVISHYGQNNIFSWGCEWHNSISTFILFDGLIQPICEDETINNPLLKEKSDTRLIWQTLSDKGDTEQFEDKVWNMMPDTLRNWLLN